MQHKELLKRPGRKKKRLRNMELCSCIHIGINNLVLIPSNLSSNSILPIPRPQKKTENWAGRKKMNYRATPGEHSEPHVYLLTCGDGLHRDRKKKKKRKKRKKKKKNKRTLTYPRLESRIEINNTINFFQI